MDCITWTQILNDPCETESEGQLFVNGLAAPLWGFPRMYLFHLATTSSGNVEQLLNRLAIWQNHRASCRPTPLIQLKRSPNYYDDLVASFVDSISAYFFSFYYLECVCASHKEETLLFSSLRVSRSAARLTIVSHETTRNMAILFTRLSK